MHLSPDEQRTAALLDLNYYLPCRVAPVQLDNGVAASRTIAVIGLWPHAGRRLLVELKTSSFSNRWPWLYRWHRSPECQPLCAPGRKDC